MAFIRTIPPEEASGALKEMYDQELKASGFISLSTTNATVRSTSRKHSGLLRPLLHAGRRRNKRRSARQPNNQASRGAAPPSLLAKHNALPRDFPRAVPDSCEDLLKDSRLPRPPERYLPL